MRLLRVVFSTLLTFAVATAVAGPAVAAQVSATPGLTITASPSTNVGLQIFANVYLSGGANPSGTVTFRLYSPADTACATPTFTSTIAVSGSSLDSASYTTAAAGTYRWTVAYSGDADNSPVGPTACSAPGAAVVVSGAKAVLTIAAPAPVADAIHGQVFLGDGFDPTGSVTFYLSPPGDTFCSQTIFTSTVPVNGNGTYNSGPYDPTVTGTYRWRASYSGDANNVPYPVTACLDQNAGVDVTSIGPPSVGPPEGEFTYPVNGASAVDTTKPFTWSPAAQAQAYDLVIGTSRYGNNLVSSGVLAASTSSYSVPALPTGRTLYATLLTETDGSWTLFQAITFTAAAGLATFTNPVAGQTGVATTPVYRWSTIPQAQAYYLVVGSSMFGTNLVNSGPLPASQSSYTGPTLPAGTIAFATLLTETDGTWTRYQEIAFLTS